MSDEIKYLDFEVVIKKDEGDEYVVVAKSGKRKAETRFANPFNDDKRKLIRSTVTTAVLRSATAQRKGKVRSSASPEVREIKNFGSTLFSEAINGPVVEFYKKCTGESDRVRLRLTLDESVDDLPWEFMCWNDDFVALNPDSPVVRYIEGTEPFSLVKVEYPLRVLVVVAKPSDLVPLEGDDEKNSIMEALKPVIDQGLVQVDVIDGKDTWEKLIATLRPNRTHILHFIGHGDFDRNNGEGVLIMEDSEGKAMAVDSERLRYLVKSRSRLALVVLNSCLGTESGDGEKFSSVAAGLVKSGVPAVIAMQFEISDESARVIAKTFYTSLALNMPVDAALTEARLQIFLDDKNNLEWATPILYMQVPDGQLFEFKGPRPKSVSANLDSLVQSPRHDANRADQSPRESQAQAGWKDRLYQFGDWFTSTPEVQYKPEPGAEPARGNEKDVFEKGRELWNDWFRSKNRSATIPDKTGQRPVPAMMPPSQQQLSPPPVTTAQTQPPSPTPLARASSSPNATPSAPRSAALGQAVPPSLGIEERIDSTVYAPNEAMPGNSFLVQVFVHLPEQAAALDALAKLADADASRRVGGQIQEPIARGAELTFLLTMPGLEIDDPSQSCIWRGEPAAVQFGVTVPKYFTPKDILGTVTVCSSTIPIGHLKFKFTVVTEAADSAATQNNVARNLVRYKRAFISYASADRSEVLKRVQMLSLLKPRIEYFQDLLTLEPGDQFENLIYQYIDKSDVFFVFWSKAASNSAWVEKEILYAKNRRDRSDQAAPEIIPVMIEGPPPVKPPAQLGFLHFNDRFLYFINPQSAPPSSPGRLTPPSSATPSPTPNVVAPIARPGHARGVTRTPAVNQPPESRIYQTPLVPTFLADTIRQYFVSQRCESQVLQKGAVWVTQGKKKTTSADPSLAATIVLEKSGSKLRVSIGGGRWIEQGNPVELGADAAATLITGSIAMEQQQTLLSILWNIIETRVAGSNGCRIA